MTYQRQHLLNPDKVTILTYKLSNEEIDELNQTLKTEIPLDFIFSVQHYYDNKTTTSIKVEETSVIRYIIEEANLSTDSNTAIKTASSLRKVVEILSQLSLPENDAAFLVKLQARVESTTWDSVIQFEVWDKIKARIPKFLYFGEYEMLPSKANLQDLSTRSKQAKSLTNEDLAIMALLRMANVSVDDFNSPAGYESLKAQIEGVSIALTDQITAFWKQNEDLEVEIDIKADSKDSAPFNTGPNLYLRIKNRRHRVSTPFRQRSRGFIWFFSFLVWFNDVKNQMGSVGDISELILLLDEPGLSLHALAQEDLLRYIDDLSDRHQVLYTTHSPFMIHSDRLHQVRLVEDKIQIGTTITDNILGSDPRTIFPLQAALGYTIAQNLFISECNLLVEGPSDLIYLKGVSEFLERSGRVGLNENITIVPVGGLDKVATFISLLGANGLKLAVLYDDNGKPEQRLIDMVKHKIIIPKRLLSVAQFREQTGSDDKKSADIEDVFSISFYIDYFNKTFAHHLGDSVINEEILPPGDRIVERIERYLKIQNIELRPTGGFNHYAVASKFASTPPTALDNGTLDRFEKLFTTINGLYK